MGPLSKIWATVESAKNSQDEQVEVSLGDMLRYLDQTVVLLGQAYNNISYTRRFNVLKQITGDPRITKKSEKKKKIFLKVKIIIYLVKNLKLIL